MSTSASVGPLKVERRCFLLLSSAFALVCFSAGLNALIKASQERSYINRLLISYGIIDIGIRDVFATGAVITTICALLTILSGLFCAFTWYPIKHQVSALRIQCWTLFLSAAWLFVTVVTYDYFFVNRSPQTIVDLHGERVPEPIIQDLALSLDFTYAYQDVHFLKLLAVLPWFALISTVAAGVVLWSAAGIAHVPS